MPPDQTAPPAPLPSQDARPVLIRALTPEFGQVHEVVARMESTSFQMSHVLRLEPHIIVSNRTGVPLQLLQCRPVKVGVVFAG